MNNLIEFELTICSDLFMWKKFYLFEFQTNIQIENIYFFDIPSNILFHQISNKYKNICCILNLSEHFFSILNQMLEQKIFLLELHSKT